MPTVDHFEVDGKSREHSGDLLEGGDVLCVRFSYRFEAGRFLGDFVKLVLVVGGLHELEIGFFDDDQDALQKRICT